MRYTGFIGNTYTSQSILANCEETRNWYRERVESPGGKTDFFLAPTPGFKSYVSVPPTDPNYPGGRAMSEMNGRALAVMGNGVFGVFPGRYVADYGRVAVDNHLASIAWNGTIGNQALIASGGQAYALDLATNKLSAPVLTFATPTQVAALDDYGIAFDSATGKFWVSKQNDFTSWDPTQFAVRTSAPDAWRAMAVNPPDIWLIGSQSGDVWYDAGSFPFPFAPRTGLNFKYGIVAPWSLVATGYSVIWLSQTKEGQGVVVRTSGYAPQRISTYAIETLLTQYARAGTIGDAEAFPYQAHGHTFYVLRLPSSDDTLVCDLETGDWHKRNYWNAATNQWEAWRARVSMSAFGHQVVGDPTTPDIAELSITYPTELDGSVIRRLRRAPGPFQEHRNIPIRRLEYYMHTGTSPQPPTGQGDQAVIMHRTSDDGGRTWGSERQAGIGKVGQYGQLGVRLHRLGTPTDRVNELTVSDPITSWWVVDAYLNHDAPTSPQGPGV